MKTTLGLVTMSMLMVFFTGCATYPCRITPETRQMIKSVSIVNRVYANGPLDVHNYYLKLAIPLAFEMKTNAQMGLQLDTAGYLSRTLLSSFQSNVVSRLPFALKTNDIADASFVLDVQSIGFDQPKQWPLSGWGTLPPKLCIVVTLISNPPFELERDSRGNIAVRDPAKHRILYRKVVRVGGGDGLSYYTEEEYESRAGLEKAFGEAISAAMDKVSNDW